jgi:16S rRNA (adenine1518-N6/adenine1519-N6)-dimethyltransferase
MGVRREARDALAAAGLRPQKRWGQHFLCDPAVARRIVDAARLAPGATVLEIGPGLGALTDELAARSGRLYLVEIDRGLAARLDAQHAARPHVQVLVGDVLALPLADLVPDHEVISSRTCPNVSRRCSSELALRDRVRRASRRCSRVAERLARRATTYSALSVMVQTGHGRVAFRVPAQLLRRVSVAVVVLEIAPTARVAHGDASTYEGVVRAAFGQRRKMLRNALGAFAAARGVGAAELERRFARALVDPQARAETLALEDFARLAAALEA